MIRMKVLTAYNMLYFFSTWADEIGTVDTKNNFKKLNKYNVNKII